MCRYRVLETEILSEGSKGNEKIYSQYQPAEMFKLIPPLPPKGLTCWQMKGSCIKSGDWACLFT
nr:hypothetical protein [Candidatus Contubernalis alkalaceticus]